MLSGFLIKQFLSSQAASININIAHFLMVVLRVSVIFAKNDTITLEDIPHESQGLSDT
jgi:hypothetical protein